MTDTSALNELKHILFASYSRETAYKKDQKNWNRFNRFTGQCAISSMIAYHMLGGKILCGYIEKLDTFHYWNVINEEEYDLTKEQFKEIPSITKVKKKSFQDLYKIDSVRSRYEELLSNYTKIKNQLDLLENDIYKCGLCDNVDKFASKPIYYGSNCNLLFVGEAPAKNGWHVTGKVWTSPDGKIIPSGKVFEKLLSIIDVKLFDASFTEAIKCYPADGKVRAKNCRNCQNYLLKLINLLKPNYVIPMGANATKILLQNAVSLSELAGRTFKISALSDDIGIIPIYHPSPISPVGYKNNVDIFENLKKMLCGS